MRMIKKVGIFILCFGLMLILENLCHRGTMAALVAFWAAMVAEEN